MGGQPDNQVTPFPGETPNQGFLSNVVTGFQKGANQLAIGAKNLANKVLPSSMQIPKLPVEDTDMSMHGVGQYAGAGVEGLAETLIGSEAMKGLSIGEKLEQVAPIVKMIEAHPALSQIVSAGLKYGALGAAQGGAHGAASGNGAEGAEIGGATGFGLGAAGEGVHVLFGNGGKVLAGIMRDPDTGEITMSPTKALDRILPQHPAVVEREAAEAREAAMNEKAESLMNRGKEQGALDKTHEENLKATEADRQKQLADTERLRNQDAQSRMQRGKEQRAIDKQNQPKQPQIVKPSNSGPAQRRVGSEGRPATWTNDRVLQLASKGDREAIGQAIRRGLELPENARYVMGDADFDAGSYNPRDVTTFSPEGTPIRQGGKVK